MARKIDCFPALAKQRYGLFDLTPDELMRKVSFIRLDISASP